jgi:hypothetical protein
MSEETQTMEADAPLVNLQAPEEQSQEQEAPIQLREEDPADQADYDDEPLERPDYYPQKFWDEDGPDVEKLAKSYAELEKAFKSGKHKAPEGDYEITDLVDRGLDPEDPTVQVYQEWSKKYGVSQQAFEELAGQILEFSQDGAESVEYDQRQEMEKLGERGQEKISYLERHITKASLTNTEREALAYSLNSADAINAMTKFIQGYTNEGIPTSPVVSTPEMSQEDLAQAIADPRWQTDAAWRTRIEKQWMAANS